MTELAHPVAPEQRTIDVDVQDVDTRGRTLVGYAAVYGATSSDLGGFDERIAAGAFADVLSTAPDVRALLNHDANAVLGRTRSGTLRLFDEPRGLRFELDLPDSPLGENVRSSVARGDIDGASFRFTVGRDSWEGRTRTVETVASLQDVTVATFGAYPAASVELRTRTPEPAEPAPTEDQETAMPDLPSGGLTVEDRAATADTPNIETRVLDAIRSVRKGETRSLTTTSAEPIAPPELSTFLWDRLRPLSIGLASGIRVIPTDRESIVWPRIVADVDPTWVAETAVIPAGDPAFGTMTATPKKLAHRVELSNEVLDDSEPSIEDVLRAHLLAMLALKLDRGLFEGDPAADPQSIRGLKFTAGIQTLSAGGANGAALSNYDVFLRAVGLLRSANVAPPYAVAMNPRTLTGLELLKADTSSNEQLGAPAGMPSTFTSSQLSMTETKGTATNASSAYVFAPAELIVVQRTTAEVELDRSRLFDRDMSELRAKLRADFILPNPVACVRIDGIIPAA